MDSSRLTWIICLLIKYARFRGTSFGNYTLGRPLVGGLVCGIILGDIQTGILVGIAMQVVYIALVTPGEQFRLMYGQ